LKTKALLLTLAFLVVAAMNLPAKSVILTFFTDMFNQISIKPQEEGGMQKFPIGSVSIDGKINEDPANRFTVQVKEIIPDTATQNPMAVSPESLANGKYIYYTYCNVCHTDSRKLNENGFADSKMNNLGMIAPSLIAITHQFSDGYIHNKIKYGGAVMPSLGNLTTSKERWDVVNNIRELEKQP